MTFPKLSRPHTFICLNIFSNLNTSHRIEIIRTRDKEWTYDDALMSVCFPSVTSLQLYFYLHACRELLACSAHREPEVRGRAAPSMYTCSAWPRGRGWFGAVVNVLARNMGTVMPF